MYTYTSLSLSSGHSLSPHPAVPCPVASPRPTAATTRPARCAECPRPGAAAASPATSRRRWRRRRWRRSGLDHHGGGQNGGKLVENWWKMLGKTMEKRWERENWDRSEENDRKIGQILVLKSRGKNRM